MHAGADGSQRLTTPQPQAHCAVARQVAWQKGRVRHVTPQQGQAAVRCVQHVCWEGWNTAACAAA
jgi:hypothetical protein